jgi:hypothetical protein
MRNGYDPFPTIALRYSTLFLNHKSNDLRKCNQQTHNNSIGNNLNMRPLKLDIKVCPGIALW